MVHVELFATNLVNPSHMEWTHDGRLLVSEHTAGRIKDITDGGDMLDAEPVAVGLDGPAALLPQEDGTIFVAEVWGGSIREISRGGDVSRRNPVVSGLSLPYGMAVKDTDGQRVVYFSERFGSHLAQISGIPLSDLHEAARQGTPLKASGRAERAYVSDMPAIVGVPGLSPLRAWKGNWEDYAAAGCVEDWPTPGPNTKDLYTTVGSLGQILDLSDGGGRYTDLVRDDRLIAWGLRRIGGMHFNRGDGRIYAVEPEEGSVVAVDPRRKANYRFEPRVVQGLNFPTCPRFGEGGKTLYVCSSGDGVIWRVTDFQR